MVSRLTREKVVAQAAALSDEIGFHELTITKLGRSLGIAPPGVYRHVDDLDDVRRAISRLASREAAMDLSSVCAGLSGVDALAALASGLRGWASDHQGRYGPANGPRSRRHRGAGRY
ncbi:TetR/AcrR family transcriptional regulator [Microbacterium amylolyticum]|uniref:TetR/AcrR family transcriptional regulator n=1 Tax=Microbacterium amylolyticum TaxID=936337 RepID=UPI00360B2DC0